MAVEFNAVTETHGVNFTVITLDHVAAGSNRIALLAAAWVSATGDQTSWAQTPKYGGVDMTQVGATHVANDVTLEVWRFVAPATITKAITATMLDPCNLHFVVCSYTGVDQAVPLGAQYTSFGTSNAPALTVPGVAADSMTFDAMAASLGLNNVSASPTGDQDLRYAFQVGPSGFRSRLGVADGAGVSGAVSTWTMGLSKPWRMIGVEIKPVAAAPSGGPVAVRTGARMMRSLVNSGG